MWDPESGPTWDWEPDPLWDFASTTASTRAPGTTRASHARRSTSLAERARACCPRPPSAPRAAARSRRQACPVGLLAGAPTRAARCLERPASRTLRATRARSSASRRARAPAPPTSRARSRGASRTSLEAEPVCAPPGAAKMPSVRPSRAPSRRTRRTSPSRALGASRAPRRPRATAPPRRRASPASSGC
jgi:hypothetical protein